MFAVVVALGFCSFAFWDSERSRRNDDLTKPIPGNLRIKMDRMMRSIFLFRLLLADHDTNVSAAMSFKPHVYRAGLWLGRAGNGT